MPGTVIVITNQFSVISDSLPFQVFVMMSSNNTKNKSGEKGKKVNCIENGIIDFHILILTREKFHNFINCTIVSLSWLIMNVTLLHNLLVFWSPNN